MDRLKYFKSEFNTKVAEEKMMMLRRWAVRKQFVSGAYLWKYLSYCYQILHTTPLGGLVVPFGVFELWPTFGSELWPI